MLGAMACGTKGASGMEVTEMEWMKKIRNAKLEFIEHVNNRPVRCAQILHDDFKDCPEFLLMDGHSDDDYVRFLNNLNFEYQEGLGEQQLFGTIWYMDGTWSERERLHNKYHNHYEEWWDYKCMPRILDRLKG